MRYNKHRRGSSNLSRLKLKLKRKLRLKPELPSQDNNRLISVSFRHLPTILPLHHIWATNFNLTWPTLIPFNKRLACM